jgi:hypothetical protein
LKYLQFHTSSKKIPSAVKRKKNLVFRNKINSLNLEYPVWTGRNNKVAGGENASEKIVT